MVFEYVYLVHRASTLLCWNETAQDPPTEAQLFVNDLKQHWGAFLQIWCLPADLE